MLFGLLISPVLGLGARDRHPNVPQNNETPVKHRRAALIAHWYRGPEGRLERHWDQLP
jgi:hypothetical protein